MLREPKKSERERYILVAAIVKVAREGVWNICVAERCRNINNLLQLVVKTDIPS